MSRYRSFWWQSVSRTLMIFQILFTLVQNCEVNYFLSGGVCVPCQYSCRTCSSTLATGCLTCESGARLQPNGSCGCDTYALFSNQKNYMVYGTGACKPCHFTCLDCEGDLREDCKTCRAPATLTPVKTTLSGGGYSLGTCTPPLEYFIDPTGLIKPCHFTCKTCFSESYAGCLSCHASLSVNAYGVCYCGSNKALELVSGVKTCVPCHISCVTCSGSGANQCLTCYPFADLTIDNRCVCQPGYYQLPSGACSVVTGCFITCSTCKTSGIQNACLTCKDNGLLTQNNICACKDGYFSPSGTNTCSACTWSCKTCHEQSSIHCLSCNNVPTYTFSHSQDITPYTQSFTCGVTDGNTLNSNTLSVPCYPNYYCRTCGSNLYYACTSCPELRKLEIVTFPAYVRCLCPSKVSPQTVLCDTSLCPGDAQYCQGENYNYNSLPGGGTSGVRRYDATSCGIYSKLIDKRCYCEDGTAMINYGCEPCPPTFGCFTCKIRSGSNPATLECSSCFSNMILTATPSGNTCVCRSDSSLFFDALSGTCVGCHPSCKTCSGGSYNQCTSCWDGTPVSGLGMCGASLTPLSTCAKPCSTCFNSADPNACLSCPASMILTSKFTCECQPGYYASNVTGSCMACYIFCVTCVGPNYDQCTSCHPSMRIRSGAINQCDALPGLLRTTAERVAYSIHRSCNTALYWAYGHKYCTTCKTSAVLDFVSDMWSATYPHGICRCNDGFFMSQSTGACLPCHASCATCVAGDEMNCLTVPPGKNTVIHPQGNFAVCDPSLEGYVNLSNGNCEPCHASCLKCWGPLNTNCFSCKANAYMSSYKCLCQTGYYYNTATGTCDACHITCVSCTGPLINQCTGSCREMEILTSGKCVCELSGHPSSDLTREPDGTCHLNVCHPTCRTCNGTLATNCVTCPSSAVLVSGKCDCKPGFGLNPAGNRCIPCLETCTSCLTTDYSSCTACKAYMTLSAGSCTPNIGYYFDLAQKACSGCHFYCKTCTGPSIYECSSCKTGASIIVQGSCGREPGYGLYSYKYAHSAFKCVKTCSQCTNSQDLCASCYLSNPISMEQVGNSECICPEGYMNLARFTSNDYSSLCEPITSSNPSCYSNSYQLLISNNFWCTMCKSTDMVLVNGKCICKDYRKGEDLTNPGTCALCHSTCLTCSVANDGSKCLSCGTNAILDYSSGTCQCQPGWNFNLGTPHCSIPPSTSQNCDISCQTCTGISASQCTACKSGATLSSGSCVCPSNYYRNGMGSCDICHHSCLTCSSGLPNGCTTCQPGLTALLDGTCRKTTLSIASVATPPALAPGPPSPCCHATCNSCYSPYYKSCLSCNSGAVLNGLPPTNCICASSSEYMNPETGYCAPCHLNCLTCTGPSTTECLSCKTGAIKAGT
jgi:hypothetical protein